MKSFRVGFWRLGVFASIVVAAFLIGGGCATDDGPLSGGDTKPSPLVEQFRVGDKIHVEFSAGTAIDLKPVDTEVNDHGEISLPLIGTVNIAGKTIREVEEMLQNKYVPDYYKNLTVTVTRPDRFFTVGGEVKRPDRYVYSSGLTVTKAIQTAGDFTEFANRTNVRLRRTNGTRDIIINVKKALDNPEYDRPVYPGDTITVKRRLQLLQ